MNKMNTIKIENEYKNAETKPNVPKVYKDVNGVAINEVENEGCVSSISFVKEG